MDSENNIDNMALYLFLFLSLLSVGNDVYQVYLNVLETDFIKEKQEKAGDYYKLFQNVLCNNVKKVKNKLILENNEKQIKKEVKEKVKEEEVKEEEKKEKKEKKKKKVKKSENNIIDKKQNDEYDKNINILKNIRKKNTEEN